MNQSIYHSEKNKIHILLILTGIAIIAVGSYLTGHYFDVHYPSGLSSDSMCDINSFFTCSGATNSPLSNIVGVPVSLLGTLLGVVILAGYFLKNEGYEKTVHLIVTVNLIGCLVLFAYSLIVLKTLCPFCTVYYFLSLVAFLLFKKSATPIGFDPKSFAIIAVLYLAASWITYSNVQEKSNNLAKLSPVVIKEYDSYTKYGDPSFESKARLVSSTEKFSDAPIQITKFSDFQCPACKKLSEIFHFLKKRYEGKINIQYFFYPLDTNCNAGMKRQLHPFACQASYIAYCAADRFQEVHDYLFAHQADFGSSFLENYAKKLGVLECSKSDETKQAITKMLAEASKFNVSSTPTYIVNGVKIEGAIPLQQNIIIMDELIKRSK